MKIQSKILSAIVVLATTAANAAPWSGSGSGSGSGSNHNISWTANEMGGAAAHRTPMDARPAWVQRIEFEGYFGEDLKPRFSLETVQPFYQSADKRDTVFGQFRLSYDNNDRTTANFGVGYRRLVLGDKIMLGGNLFYDHEFPTDHQRFGAGLEVRSSAFELNANWYDATSNWIAVSDTLEERAQDGYAVELGAQVPYLPWAHAFVSSHKWQGIEADDVEGETYSLRLRPTSYLEVEAGVTDDDATDRSYVMTRLRLPFGQVAQARKKQPWIDSKPFRWGESMAGHTLDRVRRENIIRVETRVIGDEEVSEGASVTVAVGRSE